MQKISVKNLVKIYSLQEELQGVKVNYQVTREGDNLPTSVTFEILHQEGQNVVSGSVSDSRLYFNSPISDLNDLIILKSVHKSCDALLSGKCKYSEKEIVID